MGSSASSGEKVSEKFSDTLVHLREETIRDAERKKREKDEKEIVNMNRRLSKLAGSERWLRLQKILLEKTRNGDPDFPDNACYTVSTEEEQLKPKDKVALGLLLREHGFTNNEPFTKSRFSVCLPGVANKEWKNFFSGDLSIYNRCELIPPDKKCDKCGKTL